MKILRILVFIIAALAFLSVFAVLGISSHSMILVMQTLLAILITTYGVFFKKIPNKVHVAAVVVCAMPVVFVLFLGIYGRTSNVTHNEDVVIVMGAGVIGEFVTRPLAHRLNTAFHYWQQNPDAYIIVTGGLGDRATITEAEAMARFLSRLGVPRERILLEEYSTSTYENLVFAQKILDEHFPDGFTAVLITNDFHLYRSVRTASRLGLDVNRLGANTDVYSWPVNYMREMLAVVNAWVFG